MILYKDHTPVLLQEVLSYLQGQEKLILDLTLGAGGHSLALLKKSKAQIIAFDQDLESIENAKKIQDQRFQAHHLNFKDVPSFLEKKTYHPDFILMDIGVSSHQLESQQRGFSFQKEGPLDMRMNQKNSLTASEVLQTYSEKDLADLFFYYAEERSSRRIAKQIVLRRKKKPFLTTLDLAEFVKNLFPGYHKIHPATKVFQALRIHINDELEYLETTLPLLFQSLNKRGRLLVISFHSLEDRIVKHFFKSSEGKILTKKPVTPSEEEIDLNPRSRSAKLRVLEK